MLKNAPSIRFRVQLSALQFSGNRAEIVNLNGLASTDVSEPGIDVMTNGEGVW